MTDQISIEDQIQTIMALLREKLGVRGADLPAALRRARYRLPRRVYRQAATLVGAEPLVGHPKLSLTLDHAALAAAAAGVQTHLQSIDVTDRRKGWLLGMLGGLSFNLILAFTLLIVVLIWRGFL
ncbi:MAG: hypothetical protein ACI8R4_003811 [Paracoccaceae bacterium]|jgi:hypothetical protein